MKRSFGDLAEPGSAAMLTVWGLWLCWRGPSQFTSALLQMSRGNLAVWVCLLTGVGMAQLLLSWRGSQAARQGVALLAACLWGGLDGVALCVLDWRNPSCVTLPVWTLLCVALCVKISSERQGVRNEHSVASG